MTVYRDAGAPEAGHDPISKHEAVGRFLYIYTRLMEAVRGGDHVLTGHMDGFVSDADAFVRDVLNMHPRDRIKAANILLKTFELRKTPDGT